MLCVVISFKLLVWVLIFKCVVRASAMLILVSLGMNMLVFGWFNLMGISILKVWQVRGGDRLFDVSRFLVG